MDPKDIKSNQVFLPWCVLHYRHLSESAGKVFCCFVPLRQGLDELREKPGRQQHSDPPVTAPGDSRVTGALGIGTRVLMLVQQRLFSA